MTTAAPQSTTTAAGLPAAVRETLVGRFPAAATLPLRWQCETTTRLDTGSWLQAAAVHAAVIGDRLVAVAPGPRPVVRHWPLGAIGQAVYNHVTGELVLPPGRDASEPAFSLALDPLVARSLVALAPCTPASAFPPGTISEGTPSDA